MASELQPIDIRTIPELDRLVEEARTTGKPRRLRRNGDDVATLVPTAPARPRPAPKRLSDQYPDIDSLVGAAGSLPEPRSWDEMQAIVADERAAAYRAKHR